MNSFDIKKFLIENKINTLSRTLTENPSEAPPITLENLKKMIEDKLEEYKAVDDWWDFDEEDHVHDPVSPIGHPFDWKAGDDGRFVDAYNDFIWNYYRKWTESVDVFNSDDEQDPEVQKKMQDYNRNYEGFLKLAQSSEFVSFFEDLIHGIAQEMASN